MNKLFFTSLCAGTLFLCGCASKKPPAQTFDAVTPEVAGSNVPSGSLDTVRKSSDVRVYHLGRRLDSGNPNIMHEASTMYVLSDSGAWNLSPNYSPLDARHNRSITVPAPLSAEKILEIKTLKATNSLMLELGDVLVKSRNELIATKKKAEERDAERKKTEAALLQEVKKLTEAYNLQAQKLAELQLKIDERPKAFLSPEKR